jgi:hypothetical protein
MADDLGYTPGSGATVATDEISGRHFQLAKMVHGANGVAHLTSDSNPMPIDAKGELIEALEAMRMALQALTRTMGMAMPDTAGRLRVLAENPTAANLQATVSIAATQTLTTVSTLSNQTNVGGLAATEQIPSLMRLGADSLRRNISVT